MKTLFSVTLVTLIYCMHVYSDVHSAEHVLYKTCCPSVSNLEFPIGKVVHVAYSDCGAKAIIVKNVCNQTFCVDANLTSAQNLLHRFRTVMANATLKSPFGKMCKRDRCRKAYRCPPKLISNH